MDEKKNIMENVTKDQRYVDIIKKLEQAAKTIVRNRSNGVGSEVLKRKAEAYKQQLKLELDQFMEAKKAELTSEMGKVQEVLKQHQEKTKAAAEAAEKARETQE